MIGKEFNKLRKVKIMMRKCIITILFIMPCMIMEEYLRKEFQLREKKNIKIWIPV